MGKKKSKKPKIEVELTSLDEWIAKYEEQHKNDRKPELTPEQIKAEEAEKIKFAKFNKKQKASYLQTKANEYREMMALKYAAWKKIEAERKERLRIALENREIAEFGEVSIRWIQLKETMDEINKMEEIAWNYESTDRQINEWNLYVNCFPLPYPQYVQDVNAYIEYWQSLSTHEWSLDNSIQRSEAVMYFLTALDHQIKKPLNATKNQINEWKILIQNLKLMLQKALNYGTYYILCDCHNRMELSDNVHIATFQKSTKHFSLSLWTKLKVPIPMIDPHEKIPDTMTVKFENPKCNFEFPFTMDLTNISIRILQLEYDHQSWLSSSYSTPECPEIFENNFLDYVTNQWNEKQRIKYERRIRKMINVNPDEDGPPILEPAPEPEITEIDIINKRWTYNREILPVPSDLLDSLAMVQCSNVLNKYNFDESTKIYNLREYLIVGTINHINLLIVPPQPKRLMMDVTETAFELPKKLVELPYHISLNLIDKNIFPSNLSLSRRRTGHNLSIGLLDDSYKLINKEQKEILKSLTLIASKSQKSTSDFLQTEVKSREDELLALMVHLTMDIPQNVYWIDKPILCYWDEQSSNWTNNNIYNCDIDADWKKVSFRIGQFGIFAFIVNRHHCFPFKWWNMMPLDNETIMFNLDTNLFSFKILMKSNKFCLDEIVGIDENQTKHWNILGEYFHLHQLIEKLRHCGLDIFPAFDTFKYIEETTEKYWILERHIYYCMALVAFGYEMQTSKWNIRGGLRKVFFQLREIEGRKFRIVYIDEWRAFFINCNEDDWELDMTPIKGIPFAADFYQLYKVSANCTTKRHVNATIYETSYAVFELLCAFRPLSFTHFEIPDLEEEEEEEGSIIEVSLPSTPKGRKGK